VLVEILAGRRKVLKGGNLCCLFNDAFSNLRNMASVGWLIINKSVKVKCTLLQALRLCTGRMAHRGSRGIVLLFYDHGTRRGLGGQHHVWPLFTPGKDPVPIVQEAGWAPELVWRSAENFAPTGI
jgi:hypothetical protein